MKLFKGDFRDYTKQEFIALINAIENADSEDERGALVERFNDLVPHPAGSDLLFYPEADVDNSTSGVVQTIKDYCSSKNLPSFKDV